MKDTTIKGNGKSSIIRAPSDMPATFEEWRQQLIAGNGYLDVVLNTDTTGANAGCDVVGTPLSKANLLDDTTKAALELDGADPTVNDALYALSQKGSPAECHVYADNGTTVTMTKGGTVLSAVASGGEAVLYPAELGDWSIKYTYGGSQKTKTYTLEVIGIVYVYPFNITAPWSRPIGLKSLCVLSSDRPRIISPWAIRRPSALTVRTTRFRLSALTTIS